MADDDELLTPAPSVSRNLDDLVGELGNPGRFHIFFCFLLCCINGFTISHHIIISATYGVTPTHRCYESTFTLNKSVSLAENVTFDGTVINSTVYKSCSISYSYKTSTGIQHTEIPCTGKWKYDSGISTIVTEWDLVCDWKYLPSIANVLYYTGVMFGALLFGGLSDRYGRRPLLLIGVSIASTISMITVFLPYYSLFAVARFVQGFANAVLRKNHHPNHQTIADLSIYLLRFLSTSLPLFVKDGICKKGSGVQTSLVVLLAECSPRKFLHISMNGLLYSFLISTTIGSIIAWLLKDWKYLQLILSAPSIIFTILTYIFVPESTRWLVINRKEDILVANLRRIAKFNAVHIKGIEDVVHVACTKPIEVKKPSYTVLDMFRTRQMRKRSLLIFYIWSASAITFNGLSLNFRTLTPNPYLTIMFGSFTDIPAYALSFFYIRRFGKRKPVMLFLLLGGLTCLSYTLYESIVLVIIGKSLLAISFGIMYLYVPEVFPTVIRNLGLGVCSFMSRLGTMLSTQIVLLGIYTAPFVPMVICGLLAVIAGILILVLPETHNLNLPDTIADVEGVFDSSKDMKELEVISTIDDNTGKPEQNSEV